MRLESFPFYYGWVIVAAATLAILSSIPGQTMGVSVFTPRLMTAFRLSESGLSTAYGLGTILSGLLITRAGRMIDRFGARPTTVCACLAMGLTLVLLANADRLRDLAAPEAVAWGFVLASLNFFLLRFLGQGLLSLIPRVMIGRWFERRRGLATGVSGLFVSFGFGVAPLVLKALIDAFGWSGAYWALAAGTGLGMSALALLLFRERPQDHGLEPDGGYRGEAKPMHHESRAVAHEFTLEEARRTAAFWVYSAALSLQGLLVTAATFHIIAIAEESGIGEQRAVAIFLPMSVVSVCTNFTAGYLSDRTRLRNLLVTQLLALAVGVAALIRFDTAAGWWIATLGFGVSGGLFAVLVSVTWPRFYGTRHLGAISGQNMAIMVLTTSIGPLMYSGMRTLSGSFDAAFLLSAALPLAVIAGVPFARNPQDRYHKTS
jgi:MFS transporter, OFA family, oxalate/formate antiporter